MGRNSTPRADSLCRGENKGGNQVRQILDDTAGCRAAKLGQGRESHYADAEEEPLP